MARRILAVVAGLVAWVAIVSIAGLIMRSTWREYASVADAMTFTLPMMFARLGIGAFATLTTGWITAVISHRSKPAILTSGLLLLVVFVPQHILLWNKFPVWYHLTFLVSLVPLTYLGANISPPTRSAATGESTEFKRPVGDVPV